jgi:hypothetical protein
MPLPKAFPLALIASVKNKEPISFKDETIIPVVIGSIISFNLHLHLVTIH